MKTTYNFYGLNIPKININEMTAKRNHKKSREFLQQQAIDLQNEVIVNVKDPITKDSLWVRINKALDILFPSDEQPTSQDMINNVTWTKSKKKK